MSYSPTTAKSPRGQIKCNLCRKSCPTKNGDWFIPVERSDQQVFLCRECEAGAKGAYKRASLPNLSRH